ncbi:cytosine deaminase [Mycoplana sp. BE70]|uniref:amidohydrolase family protein n=1 Tax=Mycoplana sp. BE70 TaxID=2817775 RepID=UPI00285C9E12|nr:amidohydrolase family protein [Mycoplana sp. BE70]MDR6758981.1 cytosine deaminase [Mycoplana sp. BE70]
MTTETTFRNARQTDGHLVDIRVSNGTIRAIESTGVPAVGETSVDLLGRLVIPGLVEGHIHLDTSFYGDEWKPHRPCTNGFDVRERVAFQADNMAKAAPMGVRARNQLELCIANGATHMRSHVMVDGSVGLKSLETILAVRDEYRDRIDIQLVAFPQSGILSSPGTPELLDEAIGMGADLVGGLDPASFDRDVERHLDVVFGVAERRGVGVDIHLHDMGTLGIFEIEQICARTQALGMNGKVAISHAYGLGDVVEDLAKRTGALLARSGVAIMTNAPGDHAFPPVALLRREGVTVFSGSDNIRDSWWPFGDGDMLSRASIIAYRSGFYTDDLLSAAFDVVTAAGAKALGIENYGIRPGARADFVVLDAPHIPQAVVEVPKARDVYKGGRLVASNGKIVSG